MAHLPPRPPAGRAPQGGRSATGKAKPKDALAGDVRSGGKGGRREQRDPE